MKTDTPISENASFVLDNDETVVPFKVSENLERQRNALYEALKLVMTQLEDNQQPYEGTYIDCDAEEKALAALASIEKGK
jgi:hypothetical protein